MSKEEHFVVIGAGHAGGVAVQSLRNFGHEGRITLIGEEATLPYERPPLSKDLLHSPNDSEFQLIRDAVYYNDLNIDILLKKTAVSIDADAQLVVLNNGESIHYDKLLLTTGGRPQTLDLPGSELENIFTLRTIEDSRAVESKLHKGARILIVGGGFIGLEVAASARMRGAEVVILEANSRLMGRTLPAEVSDVFLKLHTDNHISVRLNQSVKEFLGKNEVQEVTTNSGEKFEADAVIVGIGILPETDLAESAKIKIDNGIVVDEFARTSNPFIFAAGDNTNHFNPMLERHIRLEAWLNAQEQALAAARTMCNELKAYNKLPWMWTDQFDVNLQIAGFTEKWDNLVIRGDITGRDCTAFQVEGGIIKSALSINRPRDMRVARRMISAQLPFSEPDLKDDNISLRDLLKRAKSRKD